MTLSGNTSKGVFFIALLALSIAMSASLFAQTIVTGEIAGTITDPSGAVVPNATVTAKSDAYGNTSTAKTNTQGEYRFALLRPGTYTLSVTASGMQAVATKATVSLGQASTVNIKLTLQQTTETVQVTEEAPLLQSENANLATSFDSDQLRNLPAGGNDMTVYAQYAPGSTLSTGGGYGNFSSFGLPGTSNMFTINGSDNMDPYLNLNNSGASNLTLGSNEIQEAAVVTNGYTGQYGRQAGAQVNYVTRTGSNDFHGNASWWWNGNKLNANDWFNNASDTPRPHAVSNEWAWSIGGPVVKNKLFFYVDQEGLRYVLPSGGPIYIPTAGFASYVLNNLNATNPAAVPFYTKALNVYAGASGAGRATPVTPAIDPALGCGDFAQAGYGTTLPCARYFQSTVNNLNTEWLLATRMDYNATDRDRLYFRFWTDHGVQATGTDAINSAFSANSVQPQWIGQAGYTRTISANAVNQLLLSGEYYSARFGPPNLAAALAVFPTTFNFQDGLFSNLGGGASPNGLTDALSNFPNGRNVAQWQIVDDYAYNRGNHQFKFGVNFRRDDVGDQSYGPMTSGLLTFNSMTDFVNGTLANGSTYAQAFARIGGEHIGLYSAGYYAQDQWKVSPKLSVTFAFRLEQAGNPTCARYCFDGLNSTFAQLTHDVTQPYNSAIHLGVADAFRNFSGIVPEPRVGLAYKLGNKTVIRGGVGLFADQFQGTVASRFFTNAPNEASFTTTSGIVAPGVAGSAFANVAASNAAFQQGFASGATLAQLQASVPGFAIPNLNTQAAISMQRYTEWNFEIQRELTPSLSWSENFVGNHGWDELNQNTFPNAYSTTGFGGLPTTAPDPRFGEIRELSSTGYSNYDGLVSSVRWRLRSLVGQFNYVWSHALDTCSNNCLEPFNALGSATSYRYDFNPAGASAQYGNADYDVRHSFNANYVWTIPTHLQNGALKNTLGGWAVGGSFLFHSGYPFSVINSSVRSTDTKNTTGIATTQILADWAGGSGSTSCTTPNVACFPKSEFLTTAQQNNFGNLARNSFRGPHYFDTDLNLNKGFTWKEKYHFLIGASFFNILNHPNFDLPVNNLALGNFGNIVSTVSPPSSPYGSFTGSAVSGRVIQSNLRFQF